MQESSPGLLRVSLWTAVQQIFVDYGMEPTWGKEWSLVHHRTGESNKSARHGRIGEHVVASVLRKKCKSKRKWRLVLHIRCCCCWTSSWTLKGDCQLSGRNWHAATNETVRWWLGKGFWGVVENCYGYVSFFFYLLLMLLLYCFVCSSLAE